MERLLDFIDIALIPAEKNSGVSKYNFSVEDELDKSRSLPIFTSPMDSVVSESNWKVWANEGIKPILPRTSPLNIRLEGCQFIFAAFSLKEVQENFLMTKRISQSQFKICIDPGNGHDTKLFEIGKALKAMYGPQVNLMGGNIGNPKTYGEYCKIGFDYVRVGMSGGSLVNHSAHGFAYPQASLLIDTLGVKNTSLTGLKHTKIISDGGITGPVDILKAIALGADYVMIGREFVKLVEAAGPIMRKSDGGVLEPVENSELAQGLTEEELKMSGFLRMYAGNTSYEMQAKRGGFEDIHDWMGAPGMKRNMSDSRVDQVKVTKTLKSWLSEMYQCFNYGFTMSNARDWQTFKSNARYVKVQI
jgi:hypothetical protein